MLPFVYHRFARFTVHLEHSQYKNDATQLKNFLGLKLPSFFLRRVGDGKKAAISKSRSFSTEFRRSYIDCTLGTLGLLYNQTPPLRIYTLDKQSHQALSNEQKCGLSYL